MPILPKTMRAVRLTGHGGLHRLEYRDDVPVPEPGPGEVLVRVLASAVNNTDINTRTSWYSETVQSGIPESCAHAVRSDLSAGELASFPCAYTTAENLVSRTAVAADGWVLITGASGGVGSAAVQLCKRRGANVIVMAGERKHDALRALGADVCLAREVDDLGGALAGYCPDGRVHVVLDPVCGAQFGALVHALRKKDVMPPAAPSPVPS